MLFGVAKQGLYLCPKHSINSTMCMCLSKPRQHSSSSTLSAVDDHHQIFISFLLSSYSWTTFLFQERIILHSFKSIICRLCFASLCFKFSDQISVTQFLSFHSETARLDYHSTDHYSSFILLLIKKSKIKKIISFSHGQHFYN